MKRGILSLIFIVALGHISAQERPSFTVVQCDNFATDIQNNLYFWKDGNLCMYTIKGEHIANYSDTQAGPITSVSVNTGTKVLVFHQESGSISLLNNKLALIEKPIQLYDKGWYTITEAALLGSSQIVLYDAANEDLIITDLNLTILNKTHCDFGKNFTPQLLRVSSEKEILLIDSTSGVYFFDSFGTFEKKIALLGIEDAHFYNGVLFYLIKNQIHSYRLLDLEYSTLEARPYSIKAFNTSYDYNYFLDKAGQIHIEIKKHD